MSGLTVLTGVSAAIILGASAIAVDGGYRINLTPSEPFGHPVTAAGVLFPGWGVVGAGPIRCRPSRRDDEMLAGCRHSPERDLALVRRNMGAP